MINELIKVLGFQRIEAGTYKNDADTTVRFAGHNIFITEKHDWESEGDKLTALTYASGQLDDAQLVIEKDIMYFLPNEMDEYHTRIVVVHYIAPLVAICRPLHISRIKYNSNYTAPDEMYNAKIKEMVESRFSGAEIRYLCTHKNYNIYLATSFETKEHTGEIEHLTTLFNREPKNKLEDIIIEELKKTLHVEDPQQIYNTLLHEENHPVHPLDV